MVYLRDMEEVSLLTRSPIRKTLICSLADHQQHIQARSLLHSLADHQQHTLARSLSRSLADQQQHHLLARSCTRSPTSNSTTCSLALALARRPATAHTCSLALALARRPATAPLARSLSHSLADPQQLQRSPRCTEKQ